MSCICSGNWTVRIKGKRTVVKGTFLSLGGEMLSLASAQHWAGPHASSTGIIILWAFCFLPWQLIKIPGSCKSVGVRGFGQLTAPLGPQATVGRLNSLFSPQRLLVEPRKEMGKKIHTPAYARIARGNRYLFLAFSATFAPPSSFSNSLQLASQPARNIRQARCVKKYCEVTGLFTTQWKDSEKTTITGKSTR